MAKYHVNVLAGLVIFGIATIYTTAYAESSNQVILATIGNDKITLQELEDRISKLPPNQKIMYAKDGKNRYDLLKEMIRIKVFSREARARGWQKEKSFKDRVKKAENALLAVDYIKKNVLLTNISPQEAKKYYAENRQHFVAPESIKTSSVYIDAYSDICPKDSADKKVLAKKIRQELINGGDFSALSKKYGELVKVENKPGDYFSRGRLIPEIEETVFKLKVGEISPLLETEKGFAIVKLEDRKPPHELSFSEVEAKINEKLKLDKVKEQYQEVEGKLFAKYKVNFSSDSKSANIQKPDTTISKLP